MSVMDKAEDVVATIKEYVGAWAADWLKQGMGVLPERERWVSEHEMRERFVNRHARRFWAGMTEGEREAVEQERRDASASFGKGLATCERLGLVTRDPAPQSTSIRLA